MRQLRFVFLIAILAILVGFTLFVNKPVLAEEISSIRSYTSQNQGFHFQYPSSWGDAMDTDDTDCHTLGCFTSFVIRDPFSNSIDVFIIRIDSYDLDSIVQDSCKCNTLVDFANWDYDRKFKTDNNIIFQNLTSIGHHDALQMKLVSQTQQGMTQKLIVWAIQGNTGYRIQYSAPADRFTEYSNAFESMLSSFTFPEPSKVRKQSCLLFDIICF